MVLTDFPIGKRCVIRLRHRGCWASELSQWLAIERPDLDLMVYGNSVNEDPASYRAVAVIKSREKKKIDEALHSAIMAFLLQHKIVRSVQPRLPRPSPYTMILLIATYDEEAPGAIRAVLNHGGKIHPQVGIPVINGVEHVTFFADAKTASTSASEIQAEYSKQPDIFDVQGMDLGEEINDETQLFQDPCYLPTYILCSEERRKDFIEVLKKTITEIVDWINKNAPWLIPLLVQIMQWLMKDFGPTGQPPPIRFLV
jgi:hypothetical protein